MRLSLLLAFAVLPSVSLASRHTTVYLHPPPSQHQKPPGLRFQEATSVLANYLGLRRSRVAEVIEDAIEFINEEWAYLWQGPHAFKNDVADPVMLVVQSDHPEDFVPLKPAFTVTDAPNSRHVEELLNTCISQAHKIFDQVITSVAQSVRVPSQPAGLPSYKGLLDIFDLTPSESTALFMDELRALVSMAESPKDNEREVFAALKLDGLPRIASEHGRSSEVYTTAARSLTAVLSHLASKSRKLVVIVHPSDDRRRADTGAAVAALKHGVIPIWSSSQCFTTPDACNNSTNNCSGHGSCIKVARPPKTCWACTCSTTSDSKGRKTSWRGKACDRVDYIVPFFLLAGSTVFLIIIFIASVNVLYSIGNAELPNTLTCTSTSHLKRD